MLRYFGQDKTGRPCAILNLSKYDATAGKRYIEDLREFLIFALEVGRRAVAAVNQLSNGLQEKASVVILNCIIYLLEKHSPFTTGRVFCTHYKRWTSLYSPVMYDHGLEWCVVVESGGWKFVIPSMNRCFKAFF